VKRLLQLHGNRHPHEIFNCIWIAVVGILGIILLTTADQSVSGSIARALSPEWQYGLYVSLVLSSIATLFGIYRRKRIEGLLMERLGLAFQAVVFVAYVTVLLTESGVTALLASVLPGVLVAANVVRIRNINADLRVIKEYLRDHPEDEAGWMGQSWTG
jgi:hypothetical protein